MERTKDSVKWVVAAAFGALLVLFVATAIAAPAAKAATTLQWVQTGASGPPGEIDPAMAFDPDAGGSGDVLLYGGLSGDESTVESGTWEWDGSEWTQVCDGTDQPACGPGPLQQASMADDAGTGQMILFGGEDLANYTGWSDKTWTWNGTGWTNVTPTDPSASPPALGGAAMAYDAGSGQLVLYGGYTSLTDLSDQTWAWNGSTWTQFTNAGGPAGGLRFATLAYDADTGQLILYGGLDSSGAENDGTWVWDAGTDTWSPLSPKAKPPTVAAAMMAYDPGNGLILYGGRVDSSVLSAQTLQWTGDTWATLSPTSTPGGTDGLDSAGIAFDPTSNELVLYGGCTAAETNTGCDGGEGGSDVTWLGETAPTAPGLQPAVGSANQVTLSWTAPTNPGTAAGVTDYEILRGTTAGGETPYATAGANATGYTDTSVTAGSTYYYTVEAENSVGDSAASNEVSAQVGTAPAFTSATTASVRAGVPLSFTVTTTGVPQATVTSTGALPSWLTITPSGNGAATVSGTPPAGTAAGTYQLTLDAGNGVGTDATQTLTLTVTPATQQISFGSVPLAGLSIGQTFDATATSSSGVPVTLSIDPVSASTCVIDPSTGQVLGLTAGTCQIDAMQPGNNQYLAASADETVAVVTVPTIVATVSSSKPKSRFGWYRTPVTVTFHCNAGSSLLAGTCPGPVTLSRGAAKQTVRRTITSATGSTATASVTVKLDLSAPTVTITVPKHRVYTSVPAAHCSAHDALSGVASCKLAKHVRKTPTGETVTYTATATDRAGNVAVKHLTVRVRR